MQSPEYEELLSSVQQLVRQAYALGRGEALKQVVDVLKTDPAAPPKPLALAAPQPAPKPPPPAPVQPEAPARAVVPSAAPAPAPAAGGPWWSRAPRR